MSESSAPEAATTVVPSATVAKRTVPSLKAADVKKMLAEDPECKAAVKASILTDAEFLSALKAHLLENPAELAALLAPHLKDLLHAAPASVTSSTVAKSRGRPKKETPPPAELPETEGDAPAPEDYRLSEDDIKDDVCLGRVISEKQKDMRWTIAVYRETQCGAAVCEGGEGDLCLACYEKAERYSADRTFRKWHGKVTENPLGWLHMLGTSWSAQAMEGGKLRWEPSQSPAGGAGDSASVSPSESGSVGQMSASTKMTAAELRAADKIRKEAAKAAKEAEKEAAKAAKEAEKEKAKAAKEAEKEKAKAAKEAEKAAKEAEKAAEKLRKEADKTVKKHTVKSAPVKAAASVPAKATLAPVSSAGEIKFLNSEPYWVEGKNVYSYDLGTEEKGEFLGVLGADGESIDTSVTEPIGSDAAPVAVKKAAPTKPAAPAPTVKVETKTGGGSAAAPPADPEEEEDELDLDSDLEDDVNAD
jgi:F0F1-type ATP synthase membrane subunit b/b'